MKKIVSLILLFICIAGLAFICSKRKDSDYSLELPLDKDGNYVGFCDLPTNYTIEKAKNDGYFVREDLDTVANENVWDNFVQASLRKENTSIRMVQFYTEDTNTIYFTDLFYRNGYYYMFDSSSVKQKKQPFLYLLSLEKKFVNKDAYVIVLTNDSTLTYDTVMRVISSSNMEYIKSASKFSIIMFK